MKNEIITLNIDEQGKKRLYSMLSCITLSGRKGNTGCPEWDEFLIDNEGYEKAVEDFINFRGIMDYDEYNDPFNCFLCQRIFSRPSSHRCPCFKKEYSNQEIYNFLSIHSITGTIRYIPDTDTILEGIIMRFPIEIEPKIRMIRKYVDDVEHEYRTKYILRSNDSDLLNLRNKEA